MADYQDSKALVLQLYEELEAASARDAGGVLNRFTSNPEIGALTEIGFSGLPSLRRPSQVDESRGQPVGGDATSLATVSSRSRPS